MKKKDMSNLYLLWLASAMGYSIWLHKSPFMKEGVWSAFFDVGKQQIPFSLEVRGTSAQYASLLLTSGNETAELKNIVQKNDSLFIPIEAYQGAIWATIHDNRLTGVFKKSTTTNQRQDIPFRAEYHKAHTHLSLSRLGTAPSFISLLRH